MAKFSMKKGGKEVGPAEVYAPPHTMEGKNTNVTSYASRNEGANYINEMNIAGGVVSKGNYKEAKTSGIKVRGTGAATKGLMARGPMG
jgi:hypothetical protein